MEEKRELPDGWWEDYDFGSLQDTLIERWFDDDPSDDEKEEALDAWFALTGWPVLQWPRPAAGKTHSVAIVGKAYERILAPFGRSGWEIWGLNRSDERPPIESYNRWFQLHNPTYLSKFAEDSYDDLDEQWTEDRGVTLYMDRHYDEYPNSVAYPKDEVEALVPHGRYHTSSFDWMMALAVLEGFEFIDLFGCEFYTPPIMNGEPISGRPCLEYWAGVAEGRGAVVRTHTFSDLFKTIHLAHRRSDLQYGFEREPGLELGDLWKDLR